MMAPESSLGHTSSLILFLFQIEKRFLSMRKSLQRQSWRNPENSYSIWYCKMVSSTFQISNSNYPALIGQLISRDRWKIVKHEDRCKINKRLEIKSKLPENLSNDLYDGITMFQPDKSLSVHFRPSSHGKTDLWTVEPEKKSVNFQPFSKLGLPA